MATYVLVNSHPEVTNVDSEEESDNQDTDNDDGASEYSDERPAPQPPESQPASQSIASRVRDNHRARTSRTDAGTDAQKDFADDLMEQLKAAASELANAHEGKAVAETRLARKCADSHLRSSQLQSTIDVLRVQLTQASQIAPTQQPPQDKEVLDAMRLQVLRLEERNALERERNALAQATNLEHINRLEMQLISERSAREHAPLGAAHESDSPIVYIEREEREAAYPADHDAESPDRLLNRIKDLEEQLDATTNPKSATEATCAEKDLLIQRLRDEANLQREQAQHNLNEAHEQITEGNNRCQELQREQQQLKEQIEAGKHETQGILDNAGHINEMILKLQEEGQHNEMEKASLVNTIAMLNHKRLQDAEQVRAYVHFTQIDHAQAIHLRDEALVTTTAKALEERQRFNDLLQESNERTAAANTMNIRLAAQIVDATNIATATHQRNEATAHNSAALPQNSPTANSPQTPPRDEATNTIESLKAQITTLRGEVRSANERAAGLDRSEKVLRANTKRLKISLP